MAKHDLPANQWPELFGFLRQYIKSQQPLQREVSCMSVIKLLFLLTWKLHITIIIIIYKLADIFLNNVLWITVLTRVEHTPWHLKCHLVLEYVVNSSARLQQQQGKGQKAGPLIYWKENCPNRTSTLQTKQQ